jgi:fatty-acyl-CoA synthase
MERLLNITIGQFLGEMAEKYPDNLAVKYTDVDFERTYTELDKETDQIAKGLLQVGLRSGDHIAIWATNTPEWVLLFFAAAKIGAVLVPVNTNFRNYEFQYIIRQSDCRALFLCNGFKDIQYLQIVTELCPELLSAKPGSLIAEKIPFLRVVVSFEDNHPGMYHWSQIVELGNKVSDAELEEYKAAVTPTDVSNILYTSGTTGFPKGAMLTHNHLVNNGYTSGETVKYTPEDRVCVPLPLFHCFGLVFGLISTLSRGATAVLLIYFSPEKVMKAIQEARCTIFTGVPTMAFSLVNYADIGQYDYSSIRMGAFGGSSCSPQLLADFSKRMNNAQTLIGYGLTECSPICTLSSIDAPHEKRNNTVGNALPFVDIKIVDTRTGEELPVGKSGELCVRGYNVMKGYYKMPEASEITIDKDNWLHTGDFACIDEDGYYSLTGRIKDIIIRGGENVFPKEIEEFLNAHSAIAESQVVAIPSVKYGEEVFAFIILKKDEKISGNEIKLYVKKNMAKYKVPSYVAFIEKMPLNASGKVQKEKLKEMAKEFISKNKV